MATDDHPHSSAIRLSCGRMSFRYRSMCSATLWLKRSSCPEARLNVRGWPRAGPRISRQSSSSISIGSQVMSLAVPKRRSTTRTPSAETASTPAGAPVATAAASGRR